MQEELTAFKYPHYLRGVIIVITTSTSIEISRKIPISQKCFPVFYGDVQRCPITRIWIPVMNFSKCPFIILDSLTRYNTFYGLSIALKDLYLKMEPIYVEGRIIINGEIYKIRNGKLYKRIRLRIRK